MEGDNLKLDYLDAFTAYNGQCFAAAMSDHRARGCRTCQKQTHVNMSIRDPPGSVTRGTLLEHFVS